MPLLELYAAKDTKTGEPCVARVGPAGSGHFVKMVHNGIEGGMLSALAEAWSVLHFGRGLGYDEIADIFDEWNCDPRGELRNNYLLEIGAELLRVRKSSAGDRNGEGIGNEKEYVLDEVLDKVVQDNDNTEGTPHWSVIESASRHVSAPTLATAQFLRIASGNRAERVEVAKKMRIPPPTPIRGMKTFEAFKEHLRRAVYASFLTSFCQGLEIIARASEDEGWDVELSKCIQIWRAGCIIQSEGIADLLQPALLESEKKNKGLKNMKLINAVAHELQRTYTSLKEIVIAGIDSDHYLPAMSGTLEYVKYEAGTTLPTKFMEAQMDFFGAHGFDRPGVEGEDPGPVGKGAHHYEWRPAR
ncbi:6-phosphogluconate dehydrogenase [Aspergillus crustosus]